MQAIQKGDVYFLRPPILATDKIHRDEAKKLCYELGSICSRPAVIWREPYWWDKYGSVTVIPSYSERDEVPGLQVEFINRFGFSTPTTYNFAPQHPSPIHISRLGRYVGRLTDVELDLLEQGVAAMEGKGPMPSYMETVINNLDKKPSHKQQSCKAVYFTGKKVIISDNDLKPLDDAPYSYPEEMIGVETNHDLSNCTECENAPECTQRVQGLISRDVCADPCISATGLTMNHKPDDQVINNESRLEASHSLAACERVYPKSTFTNETLDRIIPRLNIPIWTKTFVAPSFDHLDARQMAHVRGELPHYLMAEVESLYESLTSFDVFLVIPKVASMILAHEMNIAVDLIYPLKRACNIMKNLCSPGHTGQPQLVVDIRSEEYQEDNGNDFIENTTENMENYKVDPETPVVVFEAIPMVEEDSPKMSYKQAVEKLQPWLKEKTIMNMPDQLMPLFMEVPAHMLKARYSGRKFDENYKKLVREYKGKTA